MNERATNLDTVEITEKDNKITSPNLEYYGPETEFNHQHFIAEGAAGLLFHVISQKEDGYVSNSILTSSIYAVQSAVHQMNICFQAQLAGEFTEGTGAENTRKDEIMELVDAFGEEYPELKKAADDAINNKDSLEKFQKHVLHVIDRKNFELKNV